VIWAAVELVMLAAVSLGGVLAWARIGTI